MTTSQLSLHALIRGATSRFTEAAVDSPRLSAEVLMAHCLGMDSNTLRKTLIVDPYHPVSTDQLERFERLCLRRAKGTPVAYLTGTKEFFGLDFAVTPATLIPRPDTELLVEQAIATAHFLENEAYRHALQSQKSRHQNERSLTFADLGTGSGCIAICLALNLPRWHGVAVDISSEALAVAQTNAQRHQAKSIQFIQSSFHNLPLPNRSLQLIVSNPPYISTDHYMTLGHEVKDFEPQSALVPGSFVPVPGSDQTTMHGADEASAFSLSPTASIHHTSPMTPVSPIGPSPLSPACPLSNGLEDFETIINQAERLLTPNGFLLMEMGYDQREALSSSLQKRHWRDVSVHKDLAGHDRVVKARWPGSS